MENGLMVVAYAVYLAISVALTVWVARTLSRNGAVFLIDAFLGKERLADSVNHLLVVGFYLINIGFVATALKSGVIAYSWKEVIELTSSKLGTVMLVLGGMHFFNLYVFNRIRRGAELRLAPPPVKPQAFLTPAAKVTP